MKDFILVSKKYLIVLALLMMLFFLVKIFAIDFFANIDECVSNFFQNNVVNDNLTRLFKIVTNSGDALFFIAFILLFLLFTRNRVYSLNVSLNLLIVYLISVIFKNVFRRERPLYNLIDKPTDFSFPSGHTMCSVAFYGFMIYLIFKSVRNKFLRWFLSALCVLVVLIVGVSRIYLNVHYFTDVICGAILGLVCLLMFVNYVKIKNII